MQNSVPLFVLDTCVLLSNGVRRVLLDLAKRGRFVPVWSDIIGAEWRRNAARIWKVDDEAVTAQWQVWQQQFPQASQTGLEVWKEGLQYSDPKDWHVIAAGRAALAARPGAEVFIVSYNTRDFNRSELRRLGLQVQNPDQTLSALWPDCARLIQDELGRVFDEQDEPVPADRRQFASMLLKRERLFRLNKLYARDCTGV